MPFENEDVLQKLAPSIVEIISGEEEEDSTTLGTGFVVTDDGLIVTCRHVVTDSQSNLINSVKVRFHTDGKTDVKYAATTARDQNFKDVPSIDIAFLKLDKLPEKGITPVKLDDKVVSLNNFASIGFKKAEEFTGLAARGEIRILTNIKNSDGSVLSPEVIQLHGQNEIEPGMSGAPVLDIERDRVIGIITERYIEQDNPAANNMAFALPVKAMIELYPSLREKNQGLTVLSKFLRAIGEERSSIYKWIDEVYVPPIEYDQIKSALKRDRIVFITGTKEFGKTFTAVRLLYECFKEKGYQPRWVKERKEQEKGSDPQELARIRLEEGYIKPHQIIYFEDPFGKTEYERSSDLEDRIGSIIDSIHNVQDAYVIITSREEVFKEFKKEKLSSVELANFEKKLNLKKASYDSERRKEMLLRWAKVRNCRWLLDSALKEYVLKTIENHELLPTPLNIKDFVMVSQVIQNNHQLKDLMKQKSQETARQFGVEIIRMKEDEKVLFLAFPYVGYGDLDFVETMYESIITSNREPNQKYYMDFKRVIRWFEGDKIDVSDNKVTFSHPSYYKAFQYAIASEKDGSDRVRAIFGRLLQALVSEDEAAFHVAHTIVGNLDKLPRNFQHLLFKLADKDIWAVTNAIAINFDKLPPEVREELLIKLSENDKAAGIVYVIASNFNNLPSNVQQLLFKLAHNDEAASYVAESIAYNFNNLPSNVQQLLFKLAYNDEAAGGVADAIIEDFNNLPSNVQQLLFKLADNKKTSKAVFKAIKEERSFYGTEQIPENIRKEILAKIKGKRRHTRKRLRRAKSKS